MNYNDLDRKQIFITWLFGSIVLMLVVSCVSMLAWNYNFQPEPNSNWKPVDQISGMLFQVPIGWLLSFMSVFGWVSLLFMAISVFKKWPGLLLGSALATVLTGIFWPMIYVTMLKL